MTAPRWQKVLADLWGSRVRSLTVVASIAVGLFAIGIIANIYAVVAADMRSGYVAVNAANIYMQVSPFDQAMVDSLAREEGVREAAGIYLIDSRVRTPGEDWESIRIQAANDWSTVPLNRLTVKQGKWPPADGEIVLDQYKLQDLGAEIGSTVRIEIPGGSLKELTVVGVVQDLTIGGFGGGAGFFYAPAMGYIDQDALDILGVTPVDQYNTLYATVTGSGADLPVIKAVMTRLTEKLEDSGMLVITSKAVSSEAHPNAYLVDAIIGVLLVIGLLVVFLSGFLITNTLQALLGQQVQQIGIMKSVGARQMQVVGVYMMLILIFGLLAFAAAVPLANLVSHGILQLLAGELNFVLQGQRIIPGVVILQAALALIVPQIAAWLPIIKGTRISVQEALSGIHPAEKARLKASSTASGAGGSPAAARPRRRPRLLSRPMVLSIRNTFRRKGRLALTLITLTLGGAVFIGTFNARVSLDKYVEQISQYFTSDVNVTLDRPYHTERIERLLSDVPGVGYVEGWATARTELIQPDGSSGDSVSLLAPPSDSTIIEPVMITGRWIQPGDHDAVVLGELFHDRFPGLKVGDTLKLNVNGRETPFTVVGFFRLSGKNGGFAAYTSFDYISDKAGTANKALIYQVIADRAGLSAAEQETLAKTIEARLAEDGIKVTDLSTGSRLTSIAGEGFNILILFLLFMAVLTALVGSIGLAGTMSMNVMERTREIGVMRAIGASDRILMKMVLVEGMIIGAFSYILGAALAFPIGKLLADGIALSIFGAASAFAFTPLGYGIWLGVVFALSSIASIIPARSASRLTIREVLAYE